MATAKILTRCVCYSDPPELVVFVDIDCDSCGQYTIVLPGHHVRPVIQALQEVAAAEPELTAAGEVEVVTPMRLITPGLN
jgi:hypothetical protein